MIGLGYVDPISEKWCYEVFIPRNLNDTDEKVTFGIGFSE